MAVFIMTPYVANNERLALSKSDCTMFGRVHVHHAFQILMRVYLQTCILCSIWSKLCWGKQTSYVRGSYTPAWWRNATHKCESAPTAPPVDDLCHFGPTAAFSTERGLCVNPVRKMLPSSWYRCEAFNSLMREQKFFSNRRAPSHDI